MKYRVIETINSSGEERYHVERKFLFLWIKPYLTGESVIHYSSPELAENIYLNSTIPPKVVKYGTN